MAEISSDTMAWHQSWEMATRIVHSGRCNELAVAGADNQTHSPGLPPNLGYCKSETVFGVEGSYFSAEFTIK
jgi:hypothetical protein